MVVQQILNGCSTPFNGIDFAFFTLYLCISQTKERGFESDMFTARAFDILASE